MKTYFDIKTHSFVNAEWMQKTDDELRQRGIFPYLPSPALEYDTYTQKLIYGDTTWNERHAWQSVEVHPLPLAELPAKLSQLQREKQAEFAAFFAQLDAKKTRPAADVAEALALGLPPDPEDVSRLRALNALAKENRVLLQAVMETTIPDDATPDEAYAIILQVVEITPLQGETA